MITLDNLAHRYGMLPSEALSRGDTLDLYVLDLGARWESYKIKSAEKGETLEQPKLSEDEMLNMIAKVKERKK